MSPAETARVTVFVIVVATVYGLAVLIAVRRALRRWFGRGTPGSRGRQFFDRVILGLAVLGAVCFGYGRWIEPYWVEVTHTRILSHRLPKGSRPLRIVHLSDLHSDPEPRLEERLPQLVAAEKPDVIVFSGDAINSRSGLPVLKTCLTRLAALAPTFVVRGNWDSWYWRDIDLFAGTGVRELDGTAERMEVGGAPVWIAGVAVESEAKARSALASIPAGEPIIFLYHYPYPDIVPEADKGRVDLFCAGHVHGGQVTLPIFGALVTLSKYGKQYEAGLYSAASMRLYVSRGLGMEGGSAPRVRFCSRPEVAVIEISPE